MFFEQLQRFKDQPAVMSGDVTLSYGELDTQVTAFANRLGNSGQLVFLFAGLDIGSLVAYLACLRAGCPVSLLSEELDSHKRAALIERYRPNLIIEDDSVTPLEKNAHTPDDRLALLLTTSGSTGSPKLVALSKHNLQANTDSICSYLPIEASDRTLANLPMFYSYGLSVINTHLQMGACIVLSDVSPMQREYWSLLDNLRINSIAGVPYTYSMLARLRFTQKSLPSLRYFTQAGGKLDAALVQQFAEYANAHNKRFFVMYGQTEATARMAFLTPEKAHNKPDSIGREIPGGTLTLKRGGEKTADNRQEGELVYSGENVMLGYADSIDDLRRFDPQPNLYTGDIGYKDSDGDWFITGRKKRFIKLFGHRMNLDEIQAELRSRGMESACVGNDMQLQLAVVSDANEKDVQQQIATWLKVNKSVINVKCVNTLPTTETGKPSYHDVQKLFSNR